MDESNVIFQVTMTVGEMVLFSLIAGIAVAIFETYLRKFTLREICTTVQRYAIMLKL